MKPKLVALLFVDLGVDEQPQLAYASDDIPS